jgi:hypothetical protein
MNDRSKQVQLNFGYGRDVEEMGDGVGKEFTLMTALSTLVEWNTCSCVLVLYRSVL